jgi:polysaccharide export outer membrane protein
MLGILLGSAVVVFAQSTEQPESSVVDARPFTIGIEDQLRVVVWGEPDLSVTTKVRPDGKITIPLIQDIDVDGKTPEEIRLAIASRLSDFVRDPNVTVMVEQINSFRIYFIGEVNTKGAVQLYRPTRVLQAIAMAGGPTEFSSKNITLLREEYGFEKRIQIDYKKLLAGTGGQENIYLKPGDTLIFK